MKYPVLITVAITIMGYIAYYIGYAQAYTSFLVLFCICQGRKHQYVLNPYYLVTITMLSFIIYNEKIGGVFMLPLDYSTKLMIISSFTLLVLGLKVGEKMNFLTESVGCYSENFWIIFWVGLIPTIIAVALYGNTLDMSGDEMMDAKEKMVLPILGQVLYCLPASIIIACKKQDTTKIAISFVCAIVAAFITVTKSAILIVALFFAIGVIAFQPKVLNYPLFRFLRKYAIVLVPVLLLYLFMGNTTKRFEATNVSTNAIEKAESSLTFTSDFANGMFENYLYFSAAWSNVQYNIDYNKQGKFAKNTLWQFARKLGINYEKTEKIEPRNFNVHTYMTDWYLDFGYVGPPIMSFLLGIFIFFCFKRFGLSDDPLYLAFYALVSETTIMMFFSNRFNGGSLLNYFIVFIGYSYFARKYKTT